MALPIKAIPLGTLTSSLELYPGLGAQLVRSAGVIVYYIEKLMVLGFLNYVRDGILLYLRNVML